MLGLPLGGELCGEVNVKTSGRGEGLPAGDRSLFTSVFVPKGLGGGGLGVWSLTGELFLDRTGGGGVPGRGEAGWRVGGVFRGSALMKGVALDILELCFFWELFPSAASRRMTLCWDK